MTQSDQFQHRELSTIAEDRALLRRFYADLYVDEFPDPDERESLDNMERYLELKTQGWYGQNNYHILIVMRDAAPVAGAVLDYLAEANAGVLEFLVVAPAFRRQGLGTCLREWVERTIDADARGAGKPGADCVVAEINDPFRLATINDNVDPFDRVQLWGAWGYLKLDFPYVQPALSPAQKPVCNLLLAAKALRPDYRNALPAEVVKTIVREYLRWAMRIEQPEACPEYREMCAYFDETPVVAAIPLLGYIGRDPGRPVLIREITEVVDPDLDAMSSVYRAAFRAGPTRVDLDVFRRSLTDGRDRSLPYAYHLWVLRAAQGDVVHGMASFYTFPGAGFGGYLAFDGPLRGAGRLRGVLARVEERMLRDARGARGWYIECQPASPEAAIFARVGFHDVAVNYRQPPAPASEWYRFADAPRLCLFYKDFGRVYRAPELSSADLLAAIEWIQGAVYGIEAPRQSEFFGDLKRQVDSWPSGAVQWR